MTRIGTIALICALLLTAPAYADNSHQEDPTPTVHIVQPGENLFRIALRYGIEVDALALANGITDLDSIYAGQELIIPGAAGPGLEPGIMPVEHTVSPGDTLWTLARRYGVTAAEIGAANHLLNGAQIYVGQVLSIVQPGARHATLRGYVYRVQPGDTLLSIAGRYRTTPAALRQANALSPDASALLFPGQKLVIPGGDDAPTPKIFPAPIADFVTTPLPPVQGNTFSMRLATTEPVTVTALFMDRPIALLSADGYTHVALFGVHALAEPGVYPLMLFVQGQDDTLTYYMTRVSVASYDYGTAYVDVPDELCDILDPTITVSELAILGGYMSTASLERYWDGLFTLPSAGSITAPFGVWRSYAGQMETYHSGTDFGSPPGTPIYAPAAGRVVFTGQLTVRGNVTIIDHGWGVYTGYWHQSELYVEVGQMLKAGELIGRVGNTGLSTGPHLHWEMWVGGVPVDPMQWTRQTFP